MYSQPHTEDQASKDACSTSTAALTAGLLIQTINSSGQYVRRRRWLRYIALGVFISSRNRKTRRLRDAPSYEPLAAAPTTPTSSVVIDIPFQDRFLNKVACIVKERDLNALQKLGGVDVILPQIRSHLEDDDAVNGGQNALGWNTSNATGAKGFLYFLLKSCNQYTILLLVLSAMLSFIIEFMKQGVRQGWHDGFAILSTVLILVAFPSVGNYCRERKRVRKHLLDMSRLKVNVEGSCGETTLVTISGVLVRDIVHLKEGDRVPADGLFIDHGKELVLDEVLNPKIDCELNPFLFSGSKVIKGQGRMLVTTVGANTAIAEVLSLVTDQNPNEKTLLEALLDKPNALIDYLALCVTILIALVMLIRLLFFREHDNYNDRPELKGEVSMSVLTRIFKTIFLKPQGRVSTLASVLATVVIGIQHGMPVVITIALCQWKEKVVQNHADPQNLSACVTLSLITVMCIETTGELMCNQMEVKEFWMGDNDLSKEMDLETDYVVLKALHQGIRLPVLLSATPTDNLLSWLESKWHTDTEFPDTDFQILDQRKLSDNDKCSGILVRNDKDDQILHLHWNGAASTILSMCSHYYDNTSETPISENQKRKFKQKIEKMEENGLRTVAYAYKKTEVEELREDGLILLAIVGLRCAYQEELKLAVEALRSRGVSIKLVSEDELSEVRARASELGIPLSEETEIEGGAFRRLSSIERRDRLDSISMMGSSLPKDKFLMVQRLKRKGHIVAFYGGLTIRDTPTIKEADVGITEDIWSTEMARENTDLIVRDGCSITSNLKSGSCAYHNIQQFCQLQLTACISGLLITLVATMHSGESPLSAVHLIWVNLIMCLLGGLMMVMELQGGELCTETPVSRTQSLITKVIWRTIAIQVSYQASVLLILHFMGNGVPSMNEGVRNTMIFSTYTLCQVLNLFNAMDLAKKEVLVVVLHSYWFLMALGIVLIMQVIVVQFGKGLASGVSLDPLHWSICFLLAILSWGYGWASKLLSDHIRRTTSALMVNSPVRFSNRRRLHVFIWLFLIVSVSSYCFPPETSGHVPSTS